MSNTFEMTLEQKELFDKLTKLQRDIAINVLSGLKPSEAHREAGGTCKNEANRRTLASQILVNPCVKEFLDSFSYQSVNEAIMGREEMMERLSNLSRVSMSDLITWHVGTVKDEDDNDVEQSMWSIKESAQLDPLIMASISEVTSGKEGFKIKQHSPLAAMKQLSDLAGYNADKTLNHSVKVTKAEESEW